MILCNCLPFRAPLLPAVAGLLVFVTATLAAPALPNINTNNIITVTNAPYNAVGDGATDNTLAISNAIIAAAAGGNVGGLYGGTVRIPASGTFLCGPLTMKNNVNIQIDAGATLKMQPLSVWTGLPAQNQTYGNLIYASGATNLEISGSGTIDGQGADWWASSGSVFDNRPYMIFFNGNCGRVLIQNVTIQNPPKMHIVFKGSDNNITIQGMTINTTAANAANTDGIDLVGTNCLVQNCTINAGDDNIALGSSTSSAISTDILVTNCTFGVGHGVSIGSNTAGAVSNLTVINCTFNGTDYGIRMKSNTNSTGGSGEGGIAQNLNYYNIGMTNIVDGAIVIYSYYSSGGQFGTPTGVTPFFASTQAVTAATIPVWRNITISNVNATVASGGIAGIIWGRMEVPATNIILSHVHITAPNSFDVYNAGGVQFVDSQITVTASTTSFLLFNAQLIVTNSVFATNLVTLDGLTTNGYGNSLAFYNAQASLKNTNVFDDGPLTLGDSILTISNNFMLFPSTVLNFTLDPNTNRVAVVGNLALGGTINVTNGTGFGAGTNILLTYTGILSGNLPTLGSTPAGYNYAFDTNTAGQVRLVVTLPAPSAPTNFTATGTNLLIKLKWNAVSGVTNYNLKRGTANGGPYPTVFSGLVVTNYSDAAVTNAVNYYYVVTAVSGGESTNSLQASAAPLPSSVATNIVVQVSSGQLQLSWPQDHLGWHLQIQTNSLNAGLGTNWVNVPNSTTTNQIFIPINPDNGSIFLRMVYP
ncbi:MAG: glycosyl hydrolase family 28 protein [Verrucomicrobiota bacterium]